MSNSTALNPILRISSVTLSPKRWKDTSACFRQCLLYKSGLGENATEKELQDKYYTLFIQALTSAFVKDERFGKGFTASGENIKISNNGSIISGIVKGGKYNIEREKGNVDDFSAFEKIKKTDIILDSFYFLLYTPMKGREGFLMVQVYTEESIYEVFSNYVKDFFSTPNEYFPAHIDPYTPDRFIKAYQKGAVVNGFAFRSTDSVADLEKGGVGSEGVEYNVSIKIIPTVKPSTDNYGWLLRALNRIQFGDKKLEDYTGAVLLTDPNGKEVRYSMDKSIESIRPNIYLKEYVKCDEDSGAPVFSELDKFCKTVLNEIIAEEGGKSEIKKL